MASGPAPQFNRGRTDAGKKQRESAPICESPPLVEEQEIELRCVKAEKIRRYEQFPGKPWKAHLTFADPFGNLPQLDCYCDLKCGVKPKFGRCTKYYRAWCMANGGPPKRGDRLSPNVFVGKFFRVKLETVRKYWDQKAPNMEAGKPGNHLPLPADQQWTKVGEILARTL